MGFKILIAEDEEITLKHLLSTLQKEGYEVSGCSNGLKALERVEDENFDVLIADIKMPGLTGIELLEKINANSELKMQCLPFIFLTNSATPEDIEHAYSLVAQGYFQKPISLSELSEIFKTIVGYWNMARIPRDTFNHQHGRHHF